MLNWKHTRGGAPENSHLASQFAELYFRSLGGPVAVVRADLWVGGGATMGRLGWSRRELCSQAVIQRDEAVRMEKGKLRVIGAMGY